MLKKVKIDVMTLKSLKLIFILILNLLFIVNMQAKKSRNFVLKQNKQMPCLINQRCTNCAHSSCNTGSCSTCNNSCQDSSCRACKYRYKETRNFTGCTGCNSIKIKMFNSCNRRCDCQRQLISKKNACKLTSYCDSCVRNCNVFCNKPRTIFVPRSQGSNTARDLVGWQDFIYAFRPCNYLTTAHTIEYTQSFRDYRLAQYLFGNCNLNFSGSQIQDRSNCQIIADYFGLSPEFKATLRVKPMIENVILQNQVFFGLNSWLCGSYFRANMPLVWTRWSLRPCIINQETNNCTDFDPCYMSKNSAKATCCIFKALSGDFTFGQMQQPWKYGRFSLNPLNKFGVSNIDLVFGYNHILTEIGHLGLYIQAIMPTGSKPNSRYIFEPIVGNAKHWELGGGLSGHLVLWTSGFDQTLTGYIQGYVTHMFKNRQIRSFDFCKNGPLSRYMLLKRYLNIDNNLIYANKLINAINYNTRSAQVTVSVKGDWSALLSYRSSCVNLDLGYNFYGQTQEKVELVNCNLPIDNKLFGIKGTQDVCAIEYDIDDNLPAQFKDIKDKITVNATQSGATICSAGKTNMAQDIISSSNNIVVTSNSRQEGSIEGYDIYLAQDSVLPSLVSVKDLDILSGSAGACVTHKLFGHINYFFSACGKFGYYMGLGGEFEVEALACNERTSLNQWGIWVKLGLDL